MTVPSWPAELPRPERSSWSAQPQDARLKRRSDAGPPGWRRRFSSAARLVSLSVFLSRDQKAVFDTFLAYTTGGGAVPFWMPDPTTDGWPLLSSDGTPLLVSGGPDDGKPILLGAQWLCTFGDQLPVESIAGVNFRMNFSVVVLP